MARVLRAQEVADIICDWAREALDPVCRPFPGPLPFSRDEECSRMLVDAADDPDGDLSEKPQELLALAKFRVMYLIAMAALTPAYVLVEWDEDVPDHLILPVLLGGFLAELAVPPEWRPQSRRGPGPKGQGEGWVH